MQKHFPLLKTLKCLISAVNQPPSVDKTLQVWLLEYNHLEEVLFKWGPVNWREKLTSFLPIPFNSIHLLYNDKTEHLSRPLFSKRKKGSTQLSLFHTILEFSQAQDSLIKNDPYSAGVIRLASCSAPWILDSTLCYPCLYIRNGWCLQLSFSNLFLFIIVRESMCLFSYCVLSFLIETEGIYDSIIFFKTLWVSYESY